MTSEVVILNKEAVALAADSAGTLRKESRDKIFTTVNKVFTLSKEYPVGIMIYGISNFMGIPWETLIKMYRNKYSKRSDTLEGYAKDFVSFLEKDLKNLITAEEQSNYIKQSLYSYLFFISKSINELIKKKYSEDAPIPKEEVNEIIKEYIGNICDMYKQEEYIPIVNEKFKNKLKLVYRGVFNNIKREIFGEDILHDKKVSIQLMEIAFNYFMKMPYLHNNISGIVIAGFGEDEIFPSIKSYLFDGMIFDQLIYKEDKDNNRKIDYNTSASIVPFAQNDMVFTFMTGINPKLQRAISIDFEKVFQKYSEIFINLETIQELEEDKIIDLKKELEEKSKKIVKNYNDELYKYQQKHCIDPVMEIVSNLPKTELALMAETFINLTSFKLRMSHDSETVAEPIDVAVISKGDGFIWIKRKHYFEPELNQHFFENY